MTLVPSAMAVPVFRDATPVPSIIRVAEVPASGYDLPSRVAKLEADIVNISAAVAQNQSWIGHSVHKQEILNSLDMRLSCCEANASEQQTRFAHLIDEYQGRNNKLIENLEDSLGAKLFARCLEIEGKTNGIETRYNDQVFDKHAKGINNLVAKCTEIETFVQGHQRQMESRCNELRDSINTAVNTKAAAQMADLDSKLESLRVPIDNKFNLRCSEIEGKLESFRSTWESQRETLRRELQSIANARWSETESNLTVQIENLQRQCDNCQRCYESTKSECLSVCDISIGSKIASKASEMENKLIALVESRVESSISPKLNSRCSEMENKVSVKLEGVQQQCDMFQRQCEGRINDIIQTLRESKADKQEVERCYSSYEHLVRQSECRTDEQLRALRESKADRQELDRCFGWEKKCSEITHNFHQTIFENAASATSALSKQSSELKALIASLDSAYKSSLDSFVKSMKTASAEALRLKDEELRQLIVTKADKRDVEQQQPVIKNIELRVNALKAEGVSKQDLDGLSETLKLSKAAQLDLSKVVQLTSRIDRLESFTYRIEKLESSLSSLSYRPVPVEDTMTRLHRELATIEVRGNVQVNWHTGQVTFVRSLDFEMRTINDNPTAVFRDHASARGISKDLADIVNVCALSMTIEGHTSGTSTDNEFWRALAHNRALAVKELMVSYGANPNLIHTQALAGHLGKNEASVQVRINIRDDSSIEASSAVTAYAPVVLAGPAGTSCFSSPTAPRTSAMITYAPLAPSLPRLAGPRSPKSGY
jgi:hypothetical protein